MEELEGFGVVGQDGECAVGSAHGLIVEQGDECRLQGGLGQCLGEGGLELLFADCLQVALLPEECGEGEGVGIVGGVDEGVGGVSGQQSDGVGCLVNRGAVDGELGE